MPRNILVVGASRGIGLGVVKVSYPKVWQKSNFQQLVSDKNIVHATIRKGPSPSVDGATFHDDIDTTDIDCLKVGLFEDLNMFF